MGPATDGDAGHPGPGRRCALRGARSGSCRAPAQPGPRPSISARLAWRAPRKGSVRRFWSALVIALAAAVPASGLLRPLPAARRPAIAMHGAGGGSDEGSAFQQLRGASTARLLRIIDVGRRGKRRQGGDGKRPAGGVGPEEKSAALDLLSGRFEYLIDEAMGSRWDLGDPLERRELRESASNALRSAVDTFRSGYLSYAPSFDPADSSLDVDLLMRTQLEAEFLSHAQESVRRAVFAAPATGQALSALPPPSSRMAQGGGYIFSAPAMDTAFGLDGDAPSREGASPAGSKKELSETAREGIRRRRRRRRQRLRLRKRHEALLKASKKLGKDLATLDVENAADAAEAMGDVSDLLSGVDELLSGGGGGAAAREGEGDGAGEDLREGDAAEESLTMPPEIAGEDGFARPAIAGDDLFGNASSADGVSVVPLDALGLQRRGDATFDISQIDGASAADAAPPSPPSPAKRSAAPPAARESTALERMLSGGKPSRTRAGAKGGAPAARAQRAGAGARGGAEAEEGGGRGRDRVGKREKGRGGREDRAGGGRRERGGARGAKVLHDSREVMRELSGYRAHQVNAKSLFNEQQETDPPLRWHYVVLAKNASNLFSYYKANAPHADPLISMSRNRRLRSDRGAKHRWLLHWLKQSIKNDYVPEHLSAAADIYSRLQSRAARESRRAGRGARWKAQQHRRTARKDGDGAAAAEPAAAEEGGLRGAVAELLMGGDKKGALAALGEWKGEAGEAMTGLAMYLEHVTDERFRAQQPRIVVVGDVHGCLEELKQLLRAVDFSPGDVLLFLGDLVTKGPDSRGVVKLAREAGAIGVRGNHDFEVVRWCEALRDAPDRRSVLLANEHAQVAASLSPADAAWLKNCPWYVHSPDLGMLFVHAGMVPWVPPRKQNPRLMMNMRSILRDNTVLTGHQGHPGLLSGDLGDHDRGSSWARYWKGPETIVYGHDAQRGLQLFERAVGIDTACVYGGRLTCMVLPERKLVSVPAKKAYVGWERSRREKVRLYRGPKDAQWMTEDEILQSFVRRNPGNRGDSGP